MRPLRSILLTGGAGFVGSSLARHLLANPEVEQLVVLDKLTTAGRRDHLVELDQDPRFTFVQGDIGDRTLIPELLRHQAITGVFNLAEARPNPRSPTTQEDFVGTNVWGTVNLLEACHAAKASLLQCSTDEVYGHIPPPTKSTDTHPLAPSSPYAASKASADLFCQTASTTRQQDVVIARSSTNYGPRQLEGALIPSVVAKALRNEQIPLSNGGTQIRDWLHVDDLCRGLIVAYLRGKPGQIFNFGGHTERTNIGVTRSILKILEKPESLIGSGPDVPGLDVRHAMDTNKALGYLSWAPLCKMGSTLPAVVRELASELKPPQE